MRFFFDNNVGLPLVESMRILCGDQKHELVHLQDKFPANTPDVDWIRALHAEGDWIIVSADPRISRNKAEQAAWHESGLTAFFLDGGWAEQQRMKQATALMGWWDEIVRVAKSSDPGSGFRFQRNAKKPEQIYQPRK